MRRLDAYNGKQLHEETGGGRGRMTEKGNERYYVTIKKIVGDTDNIRYAKGVKMNRFKKTLTRARDIRWVL